MASHCGKLDDIRQLLGQAARGRMPQIMEAQLGQEWDKIEFSALTDSRQTLPETAGCW